MVVGHENPTQMGMGVVGGGYQLSWDMVALVEEVTPMDLNMTDRKKALDLGMVEEPMDLNAMVKQRPFSLHMIDLIEELIHQVYVEYFVNSGRLVLAGRLFFEACHMHVDLIVPGIVAVSEELSTGRPVWESIQVHLE